MQGVDIHHGDLVRFEVERVAGGVGDVGADEVLHSGHGGGQAADEGVHGAAADGPPGPALVGVVLRVVGDQLALDEFHQGAERADGGALDADGPVGLRPVAGGLAEAGGDGLDDDGVLLALVLRIGEQERQQALLAELGDGPEVGAHAVGAGADVGRGVGVALARRGQHADVAERPGGQPEPGIGGGTVVVELGVGVVEEQEVLAFHVEHQRLGVGGLRPEYAGVEEGVEQEGGVAGLGGHAADAADVDVGALGAVEEVEVDVDRLAVAAAPGHQLALHVVVVQRRIPLRAHRPADLRARQRWHEDLRHHPGDLHHCGLRHLGRQQPVGDEEHVALEASPLVPGPHLPDDAVEAELLAGGKDAIQRQHIVELHVLPRRHRHPELQRRGIVGAQHPAHHWPHIGVDEVLGHVSLCSAWVSRGCAGEGTHGGWWGVMRGATAPAS